jgi:broad specificity phosphatase PhoE
MKNNNCTIYLVRHGRTDWNEKKLIQGHTDIPLNIEGEKAAKELAKELNSVKFDKAFSSDLLRARKTAEIIAVEHKLEVETTEALRERRFAHLEGKPSKLLTEISKTISELEESKRFSYKSHPLVESDEELMGRFLAFLREIVISNPNKNILVVTHGGVIRVFLILLGLLTHGSGVRIGNLSYLKLESDGIDFFVKETKGIDIKAEEIKNF